jgi:DNA-binding GntR family transcriptional regulator
VAKATLDTIEPNSLRHRVASALREAIVSRQFQPGDRILEEDIARQMAISRGTVREALRQLEHEGLVVSYPYRGTEVADISAEELRDIIFPVRLVLERCAFLKALPQFDARDYDQLESLVTRMGTAVVDNDLIGMVDLDIAFHQHIVERAKLPHLEQIWNSITPRMRVFFFRNSSTHASLDELVTEHRDLLDAMRSGNEERLMQELERHILVPIAQDLEEHR